MKITMDRDGYLGCGHEENCAQVFKLWVEGDGKSAIAIVEQYRKGDLGEGEVEATSTIASKQPGTTTPCK